MHAKKGGRTSGCPLRPRNSALLRLAYRFFVTEYLLVRTIFCPHGCCFGRHFTILGRRGSAYFAITEPLRGWWWSYEQSMAFVGWPHRAFKLSYLVTFLEVMVDVVCT